MPLTRWPSLLKPSATLSTKLTLRPARWPIANTKCCWRWRVNSVRRSPKSPRRIGGTISSSFEEWSLTSILKRHGRISRTIASFVHVVGYSSAYYTYLWDKVIAEDFFNKFDRNDLLAPEIALRYRSTVLEKTGSMPANDLVKSFLGRPQTMDAFVIWLNQEFERLPSGAKASGH